jgi:hypothetical protein
LKTALLAKLKPEPIARKTILFIGNVLKRLGSFILANVTGISIVTGLSSFIAAAVMPAATLVMAPVYVASILVGLIYSVLRVLHENKEIKHAKIIRKLQKEKIHYQQYEVIQDFVRYTEKLSSAPLHSVIHERDTIGKANNLQADKKDVMTAVAVSRSDSFLKRLLALFPLIAVVGAVTGWWGVITVVSIYTGLLGGAGLIGVAAVTAPAVGAAVAGLYFFARSFAELYQDHGFEQAKIAEVNANLKMQQAQAALSPTLQNVTRYRRGELLTNYIRGFLESK